jgi:hypothetical protein
MSYGQQVRPVVRARLPTTPTAAAVLAGDLLALLALIFIGQLRHGSFGPVHLVLVTIPFALGWLLLAIPAGLFVPSRLANLKRAIPTVILAWIGATLVGGQLRATSLFSGNSPLTFLLVTIAFGILFLVPWRVLVGWRLRN